MTSQGPDGSRHMPSPAPPGGRTAAGTRLHIADWAQRVAHDTGESLWLAIWADQRVFGPTMLGVGSTDRRRRLVRIVALTALGLAGLLTWTQLQHPADLGGAVVLALTALLTVPILALPGMPLLGWRAMTAGLALCVVLGVDVMPHWPWPVVPLLGYPFLGYAVAMRHGSKVAWGSWLAATVLVLLPAVLKGLPLSAGLSLCAVLGLIAATGTAVGQRRSAEAEAATQRAQREAELIQAGTVAERNRIARELHDVVAHHVSMIAIQARAAPVRDPEMSPTTRAAFTTIEEASRASLVEMRRVIGLLRAPQETGHDAAGCPAEPAPDRSPQPSLAAIPALVGQARDVGQQIELSVDELPGPIPPAVEISVYRIVQECLTNARRHSPGAPVHVRIGADGQELTLSVVNGPVPA